MVATYAGFGIGGRIGNLRLGNFSSKRATGCGICTQTLDQGSFNANKSTNDLSLNV
ncbi:hypothetical protein BFJ66_g17798 [Fusarium oxysporum f. sp. cepae]|nr:hypothetical protein BFJ67_g17655 [Fusarium oxysporum f. sp. cepae]RKK19185.1 hypothetical protein BFJ66_g17798 [Fusarium oxysporum f. sp. cepae]